MTDAPDTIGRAATRAPAAQASECRDHAAHVRHELRGALAVLIPVLSTLDAAELTPEQAKLVAVAERSVARLEQMVASIAGSGWFEADKPAVVPAAVALRPLVEQLFRGLQASAVSVCPALVNEVPEVLPHLLVDEERLRVVLTALLDNALRFTSPAGAVRVAAREESSPRGRMIQLTVADTGRGLEATQLDRVFEFGMRGDNNAPRWAGLGLGLHVARQLVGEWAGSIAAESEAGHGFTVDLSVPIACGGNLAAGEE